jgi:hypothetical protein
MSDTLRKILWFAALWAGRCGDTAVVALIIRAMIP